MPGFPPTIVLGGTSLVTTAQAVMIAPSPIVTPLRMIARAPTRTLSPIIGPAMRELPEGRRLDSSAERVLFVLAANRRGGTSHGRWLKP